MFVDNLKKSWLNLHWLLFLPDFSALLFNLALGFLFLKFSGLQILLSNPEASSNYLLASLPSVQAYLSEHAVRLTMSFLLFVFTSFFIGTGLIAMKYGLMRDVTFNRRPSLQRMWHYSFSYFNETVWLRILVFLLLGSTVVSGVVVFLLLDLVLERFFSLLTTAVLVTLALVFLKLAFFFRYPALFIQKKQAWSALKASANFVKDRLGLVIGIWIFIGLLSLVGASLALPAGHLGSLAVISLFGRDRIIAGLLPALVQIAINVWADLFLFFVFKSKG